MNSAARTPWYREPWPWILMSGPAVVVVAGIVTAVIAWQTHDALVADDYYKQGLGINMVLKRDETAQRLGLSADISFSADRTRVRVRLAGSEAGYPSLRLKLVHPTRDGFDQLLALAPVAGGLYEGRMRPVTGDGWQLQLEDAAGDWRLTGLWRSAQDGVVLGGLGRQGS